MVQPLNQIGGTALFLLPVLAACSSSLDSQATSHGTPTSFEAWCDRQAEPACPKTPPGYASSCKQIFGAMRMGVKPECQQAFDDAMECSATRATYSCSAQGTIQVTPQGACATEGSTCDRCNGKSCTMIPLGP